MALIGTLTIGTQMLTKGIEAGARRVQSTLAGLESRVFSVGTAFAGAAGALGVGAFLKRGFDLAVQAEQNQVALEVMLGSAEKARMVLDELTTFARNTPFELPELTVATRQLVAFGFSAENVLPTLQRLGDVSAGLQIPIVELAEIYGKARVQGRLFMEDIHQLSGRGIPIYEGLAKVLGKSEDKIRGLVEQGKIGFPELEKAFIALTGEGGKFEGLMERMSQTTGGTLTNISDALGILSKNFVEALAEGIKLQEFLQGISDEAGGAEAPGTAGLAGGALGALARGFAMLTSAFGSMMAGAVAGPEMSEALGQNAGDQFLEAGQAVAEFWLKLQNLLGMRADPGAEIKRQVELMHKQLDMAKRHLEELRKNRQAIERLEKKRDPAPNNPVIVGPPI
jgi:tape measure domain-containing protein